MRLPLGQNYYLEIDISPETEEHFIEVLRHSLPGPIMKEKGWEKCGACDGLGYLRHEATEGGVCSLCGGQGKIRDESKDLYNRPYIAINKK